jgi:asparagine synthase (glutamine-hydrolysing)
MCGIAGWYRRRGRTVAAEVVAAQCNRIIHRGPDDSGLLVEGDFGFGMRRLSIIDIAGGHQPMFSSDGRYAIVFNGEIYNHLDLRRELEAMGVCFTTHSDTETLLASYLRWKDDAWLRLEGMYAVAIWDRAERTLTLARDPLGIKPLYITEQHGGIAFASEIRALRVLPEHDFSVDERGVFEFFTFRHVQRPRTMFCEIRSLDPGHWLRIGPEGEATTQRFWKPRFRVRDDLSEQDWIEETRTRFQRTVEQHMLADVPVGSYLSGGVDSAAVTAAASHVSSGPIKAFTVGFAEAKVDETEAAARIARHLGCEHIVLRLEPAKTGDLLQAVQSALDEPSAASSTVPHWHLSRLASEHVKVVLCGEGSDEIFGGYKRQRNALRAARWAPLFRVLEPLAEIIDALPASSSKRWNYLRQKARRLRDAARLDDGVQRFFASKQVSSPDVRSRLFDPAFHARHEGPHLFAQVEAEYFDPSETKALDELQQFMLADLSVHMPGLQLNRLDRMSMAHSLEARVPFLSHTLVDFALSMPSKMKIRGDVGKYALRKAIEPWLPKGALGKHKQGFQLPFAEWLQGDFGDFAREAWHESGAMRSGYFQPHSVEELFAEHRAGLADHSRMLYAIAMFSCWWRQTQDQFRTGCPH